MTIYQLREVLMWRSIINVAILIFSFIFIVAGRKTICKIHCQLFAISQQQFNVAIYAFFIGYKTLVFVFNIIPFIAVSLAT